MGVGRGTRGLGKRPASQPKSSGNSIPPLMDISGFEQWAELTLGLRRTPSGRQGAKRDTGGLISYSNGWLAGDEEVERTRTAPAPHVPEVGTKVVKRTEIPVTFSNEAWGLEMRARPTKPLPSGVQRRIIVPKAIVPESGNVPRPVPASRERVRYGA